MYYNNPISSFIVDNIVVPFIKEVVRENETPIERRMVWDGSGITKIYDVYPNRYYQSDVANIDITINNTNTVRYSNNKKHRNININVSSRYELDSEVRTLGNKYVKKGYIPVFCNWINKGRTYKVHLKRDDGKTVTLWFHPTW